MCDGSLIGQWLKTPVQVNDSHGGRVDWSTQRRKAKGASDNNGFVLLRCLIKSTL